MKVEIKSTVRNVENQRLGQESRFLDSEALVETGNQAPVVPVALGGAVLVAIRHTSCIYLKLSSISDVI